MQKACDLAHTEITKLASGKRKWEMCVPVQPTDSDITLQEPLSIFQKEFQQLFVALIDENEKLREALLNIKKEDGGYMINPNTEQFESYMLENVVHHMRKEATEALTAGPLDAILEKEK